MISLRVDSFWKGLLFQGSKQDVMKAFLLRGTGDKTEVHPHTLYTNIQATCELSFGYEALILQRPKRLLLQF